MRHKYAVLVMLIVLLAFIALPALAVTAIIAVALKGRQFSTRSPALSAFLVGTTVPILVLAYGLYTSWPWPWFALQTKYDGLGQPGAWLVFCAAPVWIACLAISWLVLGRSNRTVR